MRMRRTFLLLLITALLIGCTPDAPILRATPAPAVVPVTVEVNATGVPAATALPAPSEAPQSLKTPADTPAPTMVASADFPSAWVADGTLYGADLVVYVNGIGLAYDFDGTKPSECRVEIETAAVPELPPYETHRLLLHIGEQTFCLGELRWNTEDARQTDFFGERYDWIVMDSDLCDAEPTEIRFARPSGDWFDMTGIAFITGFDVEKHTIEVLTARQVENTGDDESLYAIDPDSIAETPITLTVPENAQLTVTDEYAFMPVTRDRFFRLLENGYIGYLPTEDEDFFVGVYLGYKDGAVTYLYEDYLP